MTIYFKRTLPDHAHMYHDQELVGELTKQPDLLNAGSFFYVIHLCSTIVGGLSEYMIETAFLRSQSSASGHANSCEPRSHQYPG